MLSQSLLQLRAVILHPTPNCCVIDIETALLQQFLNIAQRERIAKIPPDGTKDDAGFGLPPLEDRGSGYHFAIVSRHHSATLKVATHPAAPTHGTTFSKRFDVTARESHFCESLVSFANTSENLAVIVGKGFPNRTNIVLELRPAAHLVT